MTVGITGASGHLGRLTTDALFERVEPDDVVLATRDPSKLDECRGARGTGPSRRLQRSLGPYTSVINPAPENPSPVAADHRATEEGLLDSGLDWSFLRNSIYAEYQVPTAAQAIASGRHVHHSGDVGVSFVSRVDCAAAAARRSRARHRQVGRTTSPGPRRSPRPSSRDVLNAHRDELVAG
jgi:NAD(P)H dehydrogenase (quinone)